MTTSTECPMTAASSTDRQSQNIAFRRNEPNSTLFPSSRPPLVGGSAPPCPTISHRCVPFGDEKPPMCHAEVSSLAPAPPTATRGRHLRQLPARMPIRAPHAPLQHRQH